MAYTSPLELLQENITDQGEQKDTCFSQAPKLEL